MAEAAYDETNIKYSYLSQQLVISRGKDILVVIMIEFRVTVSSARLSQVLDLMNF